MKFGISDKGLRRLAQLYNEDVLILSSEKEKVTYGSKLIEGNQGPYVFYLSSSYYEESYEIAKSLSEISESLEVEVSSSVEDLINTYEDIGDETGYIFVIDEGYYYYLLEEPLRGFSGWTSELRTVPISSISADLVNELNMPSLKDKEAPPLIVEELEGGTYGLIDGYHRLSGLINAGESDATVIIASQDDLEKSSEFGSGYLSEEDWINLMWENVK